MEENRSVHDPTDDPSEKLKRRVFSSTTRRLVGSTLGWIGFALFGWYFPRSLVDRETSILSLQPPYQTTGGGDVIVDFELNQPLVDPPTVDNFLLRSSSIFLPLIVMALHAWYSETQADSTASNSIVHKQYRVATVVSAFSAAMGLSEGSTVLIKLWVQRRRPNFYALCGFDSATKTCTASIKHVREANFSFPSGHSSLVCCGMTFLVWYLHGTVANSNHHSNNSNSRWAVSLWVCTCLPWGWALFVAASRLVDHWHHPSDVLAGLGLGFTTCTIAYHHWYPPVWSVYAGIPRSLLKTSARSYNYHQLSTLTTCDDSSTTTKRRQLQSQASNDMA